MIDAIYIVATVILFAALIGYTVVCERMGGSAVWGPNSSSGE